MAGRLRFPSRAKLKLPSAVSRPQPKLPPTVSKPKPPRKDSALPDVLQTSLLALKQSADAFPPLKSAVGGVIAICDIAARAKHSKDDARDIAVRANDILNVVADAVPDITAISPPMKESIKRFTTLIDKIRRRLKSIALASASRVSSTSTLMSGRFKKSRPNSMTRIETLWRRRRCGLRCSRPRLEFSRRSSWPNRHISSRSKHTSPSSRRNFPHSRDSSLRSRYTSPSNKHTHISPSESSLQRRIPWRPTSRRFWFILN
ncbi:hypothetical protein FB451DRAFT_1377819 [Mycena latifolia]|nr:hypothetical protein FB451DRAFT_1377819 [Mycena latifolia]